MRWFDAFERFTRLLIQAWALLRGSGRNRFAIGLVRIGATLVAGPPVILVLLLAVLGRLSPSDSNFDHIATVVAMLVGVALIITGVWVFLSGEASARIEDSFAFHVPDGWSFVAVVHALLSDRHVMFDGFSDAQLAAPMTERTIRCGSEIAALETLGDLALIAEFPRYAVSQTDKGVLLKVEP